jgi:hypothetical protein
VRTHVLLASVVLAGVILFSTRAVFMDEHIFLQIAKSAQSNWLFPSDTPGMFFGTRLPHFAEHTHPPVGEYYLASIYALVGGFKEVPFRLLFSVFPITAVLAFYSLARRFTACPLLVALLFAMSPAFFVLSPTLMMDIPMLAFLLAGIAFYFAHTQGRRGCLPAASACFILAAGTGYTALVPIGCLFISLLAARRPLRELLSLAAAPLAVAIWLSAMTFHFGAFPLTGVVRYYRSQVTSITHTALATLSFLGGVSLFPWVLKVRRQSILVSLSMAALLALFAPLPSTILRIWFLIFASFGIALLMEFVHSAGVVISSGKNNGEAFLILWLPATLLFFIVVGDMMNARYVLLSLPPLYLLLFHTSSVRQLSIALVPTAILSVSVAYADFAFVNSYRDWVDETVVPLQQQGFQVWSAAESGLRFNLERKGISSLATEDIRPAGPDLIVGQSMFRYSLSEPVATMQTTIEKFDLNHAFPIRTFNATSQAGFHDSRIGLLPFAISRAPFDTLDISQISPFANRLPLPENNPAWSPSGVIFKQIEAELVFPMIVPSHTTLEYEFEAGDGTAQITDAGIMLQKGEAPVTVWKNFRVVPMQFIREKN